MWRSALLGLTCLLTGCQFVGNPFAGFGSFIYDTHEFRSNPNLPAGGDETMRRVEDQDVGVDPLLPEPGDVWPGPMKAIPTMQELEQQNMQRLPAPNVPATPPPLVFPETPPGPQGSAAPPGVMVPNGDGSSTLIGSDGSIRTVPAPK